MMGFLRNEDLGNITSCKTSDLQKVTAIRPTGLEPVTYELEKRRLGNVTALELTSYKSPENQLTANLTENATTIQQDLAKISQSWTSLSPNIKAAIMILIGGEEDEWA